MNTRDTNDTREILDRRAKDAREARRELKAIVHKLTTFMHERSDMLDIPRMPEGAYALLSDGVDKLDDALDMFIDDHRAKAKALREFNAANPAKVTFGKPRPVSAGIPGYGVSAAADDKTTPIMLGNEQIGEIIAHVGEYGCGYSEYRIDSYEVELFGENAPAAREFHVDRNTIGDVKAGAESARSVLARAKRWAKRYGVKN